MDVSSAQLRCLYVFVCHIGEDRVFGINCTGLSAAPTQTIREAVAAAAQLSIQTHR